MDQQQLQQKIAEYASKLPPNAQEYFIKMDWMNVLQTIATKYQLNEQQVASLGTETTLLLLGIVHPDEYTGFLKKEINMEEEASVQMFNDINTQIIGNLRGDLESAHMANSIELAENEYGDNLETEMNIPEAPKPPYVSTPPAPNLSIPNAPTPSYKPAPEAIATVAIPVESEADISIETANSPTNINPAKDSSNIFSNAGIEMVSINKSDTTIGSQPKVMPLVTRSFNTADRFMESGIDIIPERKADDVFKPNSATGAETLSGINNPTMGVVNMLGDKLNKATVTPTTQSNQSLNKDPYKEQI